MQLTVHQEAASFLAAAAALLRSAEAENSIIATPAMRMVEAPRDDDADCYFATVSEAGSAIAAALDNADGGLLLTAGPDAAMALFAADLSRREQSPRHLVGPLRACEAFARAWLERTGRGHRQRYHLRHFELSDAPTDHAAAGRMRKPLASEHELIVEWQNAFIVEVGLPDDAARMRHKTMLRLERSLFRVWDDDGVVSYAGYGEGGETARIAPVYTPAPFRRRGYASALVSGLSRELFERGKRAIFLTTDVANPTSNRIYQKIGFRPVADHVHFDLVAGSK
ncbi:MAG TPA: GNAT family N-acetyltransferase [Casimicrobiaceae bacterium]|nr:GNAT family N-acetyltransferase [Casimicrobiaceae bacterium]